MKIVFIQTGGTIDKDYPIKINSYNFEIGDPAVELVLKKVNPNFDYQIYSILKKDSLDISEKEREKIKEFCEGIEDDKIIITHGTDTMCETAKLLKDIEGKVIILTGAMKPERFNDSDAEFNIGAAVGAINILENGIYISMSGRIYAWDECEKSRETGQFIEKVK